MSQGRDAEFFQVLGRQVRQDLFGYLILAECGLIFPEAQAPQPDHDVHDGAPTHGCRASWSCPEGVSSWSQCDRARQPAGSLINAQPQPY